MAFKFLSAFSLAAVLAAASATNSSSDDYWKESNKYGKPRWCFDDTNETAPFQKAADYEWLKSQYGEEVPRPIS